MPSPKKKASKKSTPAKTSLPSGYWQKKIYIAGFGIVSGSATEPQMKAFLTKGKMSSLEARIGKDDPIEIMKKDREEKRKARLGIK